MLAPIEDPNWADKFLRKPPRFVLRVTGGMDDDAVLYVDGQLVGSDTADALAQRMFELGLRPGDTWQLEMPHQNKVATCVRRTQAEIDDGVAAAVEVKPLNNSETYQ